MSGKFSPLSVVGGQLADDNGPRAPLTREERKSLNGPIVAGGLVIGVLVLGAIIWASLAKIAGGVPAPGVVAVLSNRQSVEHLDGGIIRSIQVKEGQRVQAGQVLFVMDDNQPRAQLDVLQNEYDSLLAQKARLEAEISGQKTVAFPPELTSRQADPRIATMIRDQENLFRASLGVYEAQVGVLGQRGDQLRSRISGLSAQARAVDEQSALISDELQGVKSLYDRGFAPKSRMLALQRSASDLTGARGARTADIASAQQAVGENQIQFAQIRQQRVTTAADQLRETQVKMADLIPRLRAAEAVLKRTVVRAPATGYVLGLTRFTEGGVTGPGAKLLDVVPENTPLVMRTRIAPDHIDEVQLGMMARVHLQAYSSRNLPPVEAKVTNISADRLTTEQGESFFEVDMTADPKEVAKLGPGIKLSPGMPVQALIVTGERSVMKYLLGPITDTFGSALREQ
jgi:HlyD family type I secretion membrane fusion protein